MMEPWHLTPEEAIQAGSNVWAQRLLAIHFGTFDLSDEPLDERVVVVGAGFGGLAVARGLAKSPVDVLVVDRENHHAFLAPLPGRHLRLERPPGPERSRLVEELYELER